MPAVPDDRKFHVIEAVPDRCEAAPAMARRFQGAIGCAGAGAGSEGLGDRRQAGIVPSLLFGWRRQAIRNGTVRPKATEDVPCFVEVEAAPPVVEIVIGGIVVRAGAEVEQDHLRRVIRAARSA